jgi:hypothetical protein
MNVTRSKPFYVVAGAGDLAVRTLREVPELVQNLKVERKDLESAVTTLQAETKALPSKAQGAAIGIAGDVAGKADAVYGELLGRGRSVVTRIRRQKATQDMKEQAGTTVRRTKAASTTAKRSAAATRTSAKRTATTAKKNASSTRTATKSAATSARKTARKTAKATSAGAAKVGS